MNGMAGGRIVAMVFFLCVSFAGVTSIINLYEAPVASLQEKLGLKRVPATAVIHVIGLAAALCIQAIVSQWMDVVSIYICPLGALLAAVMFFWIGGKKLVLESVNLGARKPIGGWYYPAGKYVYCVSVLVALIAGALLGGIGIPERRFAVILFSHSGKTPTESWRSARARRAPAGAGS